MGYDFNNNIPIYIQLMDILKKQIISGLIKPGEKIPSVRDLASDMKVNPNTMQKALVELENLNLIYTERTNGKYVTEDKDLIMKIKYESASEHAINYLDSMKCIGFNRDDAINYLKNIKGEFK